MTSVSTFRGVQLTSKARVAPQARAGLVVNASGEETSRRGVLGLVAVRALSNRGCGGGEEARKDSLGRLQFGRSPPSLFFPDDDDSMRRARLL